MSTYIPTEGDKHEKSVAKVLDAQFTKYDARNVLGHTEIPKQQIRAIVMMMTLDEVLDILQAKKPNKKEDFGYFEGVEEWDAEGYANALEKYRLRKHIESDELAMLRLIANKFIFSFGLSMRSVDRKIRLEGERIASAGAIREAEGNLGIGSKLLQTIGLGRLTKYDKVYVRKDK
jgi:hypothetical protein